MKMQMGTGFLVLVAFLVACTIASLGWLRDNNFSTTAYCVIGALAAFAFQKAGEGVKTYVAISKHDAKVANEKIRLLVNTLNAAAMATIAAGVIAPFVLENKFPLSEVESFLWLVLGLYAHLKARGLFNYLKDEEAFEMIAPALNSQSAP